MVKGEQAPRCRKSILRSFWVSGDQTAAPYGSATVVALSPDNGVRQEERWRERKPMQKKRLRLRKQRLLQFRLGQLPLGMRSAASVASDSQEGQARLMFGLLHFS